MVSKIHSILRTTYYQHDRNAKPSNSPDKILSSHNSDIPQKNKKPQMCSYMKQLALNVSRKRQFGSYNILLLIVWIKTCNKLCNQSIFFDPYTTDQCIMLTDKNNSNKVKVMLYQSKFTSASSSSTHFSQEDYKCRHQTCR